MKNKNSERMFCVIEHPETGERFLLSWKDYDSHGIPDGFRKRTRTWPLPEDYWEEVKDLPCI